MNGTMIAALIFGIGGYVLGYLSRREDEMHHRPALEAERGFVHLRGIHRRRLSGELRERESVAVERYRAAGWL